MVFHHLPRFLVGPMDIQKSGRLSFSFAVLFLVLVYALYNVSNVHEVCPKLASWRMQTNEGYLHVGNIEHPEGIKDNKSGIERFKS